MVPPDIPKLIGSLYWLFHFGTMSMSRDLLLLSPAVVLRIH